MTTVEDRLSELLHQAAPSTDGVSFEEVARRARRRRVVRAAVTATAVAAVVAVTVIAAGIVTFGSGSRVTGSGPASAGPARHAGGLANPVACNANLYPLACPGSVMAEKTTVAGAQAKAGFPVPVPGTAAASRANLTQAWVTTHSPIWPDGRPGREVALVFEKGKVDIVLHPATYQSALSYFRAFVAEKKKNGAPSAALGQLNGRPALVISPSPNRSEVEFWRNGIFIDIYSNTYGKDTLLAIASSMR